MVSLLCEQVCEVEVQARALLFYERVPSASNIADPPSRGRAPPAIPGWPAPVRLSIEDLFPLHPGQVPSQGSWGVRDSALLL